MTGGVLAAVNPPTGLPNAVVNGLVLGSVIALGAIGLALIYSIAEVPNFAQGEMLSIGAFLALFVNRPSSVPLFDVFVRDTQVISPAGLVVLFGLAGGAVVGIIHQFGGDGALAGDWWPRDVNDQVALGVHLGVAALVGGLVVVMVPSIWGGMLFAALGVGAIAPTFESTIFGRFRERGDDLATLLIVALGLSFVLRYGLQSFFGAGVKQYVLPDVSRVLGVSFPLSSAFFFDVFQSASGLVVKVVNTAGGDRTTAAVLSYSWPVVALVVVVPLAVAVAGYRWRSGGDDGFSAGQTVGPRLTAGIGWFATAALLVVLLPAAGTVPATPGYQTRIRLSVVRALVIVIAFATMGSLHVLFKETKLGVAMRASSDNLDLAKVTGINTERVMMASWIISGAYSAIAGVMLGILFISITPNIGFNLLLPMFAGVILGGVESVYGAMIGSYVVGLTMTLGIHYLPVGGIHRVSIAFAVLIMILLVKPEGILGGS